MEYGVLRRWIGEKQWCGSQVEWGWRIRLGLYGTECDPRVSVECVKVVYRVLYWGWDGMCGCMRIFDW